MAPLEFIADGSGRLLILKSSKLEALIEAIRASKEF